LPLPIGGSSGSGFLAFATWQVAPNAAQAKKNQPKENKHTLKRTQIKRFAHFWL